MHKSSECARIKMCVTSFVTEGNLSAAASTTSCMFLLLLLLLVNFSAARLEMLWKCSRALVCSAVRCWYTMFYYHTATTTATAAASGSIQLLHDQNCVRRAVCISCAGTEHNCYTQSHRTLSAIRVTAAVSAAAAIATASCYC
jgi:hypothetical protein